MLPVVLALSCAVCWLFANVTIRPVSRHYGPFRALVYAQSIGLLAVLGVAFIFEGLPRLPGTRAGGIALGVAATSALLAYGGLFAALARGRMAVVAPIIASWSALAVLAGLFLFGERLVLAEGIGIAAIILGTLALARLEGGEKAASSGSRGVAAALGSALGFGTMISAVKILGEDVGPFAAVAWTWAGELALAYLILGLRRGMGPAETRIPRDPRALGRLALPGLFEVAGFVCMSVAVARGAVAIVAPLSNLATALSVLWGVIVFRERLPRAGLAAAAAVSVGVILIAKG